MQLFDEAVELRDDARRAYFEQHCADDHELRVEVESLLKNDNAGTGFRAAIEEIGTAVYPDPGRAGQIIGPYRLVRELARGGMGSVWLADRDDDEYQREVAIKLIRNVSGAQVRERFLAERQILATLNHPNIARLLDGGSTADGAPYVVMEFIQGEPIDEYCEQHQLSISARIQLFRTVCDAVQYAHRNLIVHRDLKPANILVDVSGEPKLLDFGIAKLLSADDAALLSTPLTMDGMQMLTPHYASPEQIRGQPITTASDIYSLGVLLCQLLTGRLPYETAEGDALNLARAICEAEPLRPSSIVRDTTAQQSATTAFAKLDRQLTGDLDNIVLKALRKEPDARYSSVDELGDDLRRHLKRLPVRARPATWHYRLTRFTSRHRWSMTATTIAAAGLLTATVFSIIQMDEAIRSRLAAEQERSIAVSASLRATLMAALSAVNGADPVAAMRLLETVSAADRKWEWLHIANGLDQSIALIDASDATAIGLGADDNLISVSSNGLVRWWQLSAVRASTQLDVGVVTHAQFSADGSRLAVVQEARELAVWDLQETESPQQVFRYQTEHALVDVALSSDGSQLAGVTTKAVATWNLNTGDSSHWPLDVTPAGITMSADGSRIGLLIGDDRNGSYRVLDTAGQSLTSAQGSDVIGLALSPDGALAATAELDRTIRVRDAPTARVLERFAGHSQSANLVVFSRDGQRLASAGSDNTVRLWSTRQGGAAIVFSGHTAPVRDLQVSATGQYIASISDDGTARLWDANEVSHATVLAGHWAAFSADGSYLVSLHESGTMRLFDVATHEQFDAIIAGGLASTALAVSPGGGFFAVGEQGNVVLLDALRPSETTDIRVGPSDVVSLAFSPTDDRLLILQASGVVTVYDIAAKSVTVRITDTALLTGSAAFSPDGSTFATTNATAVVIRDSLTGGPLRTVTVPGATARTLRYNVDGKIVASGWSDGSIRLIDAASGAIVAQLSAGNSAVAALAFSPDGSRLASGARDSSVSVWQVETARPLLQLDGLGNTVQSLAYSPDGTKLVGNSASGELYTWDTLPARARRNAAVQLREQRDAVRPIVESLFARFADPDEVAQLLRNNSSLGEHQRRAALQLALHPPAPANDVLRDPFDGHALEFDGDDSHVLVENPDALQMTQKFTIETWVFPLPFDSGETPHSLRMIFNKEGEYQVAVRADGALLWVAAGPQGWLGWVETRYSLVPEHWTHIALVRDGAVIKFYVNGRLVQRQPVPEEIGDQHDLMNEFRIGGRQHTPSSFRGRIDEMRIWGSARSVEQIQHFMRKRPPKDEPGLLAAWSFDEGIASTTADRHGGHTGAIVDAVWVATSIEND
jgi:serine/threonine protein kinase/WD40 repeat protein